MFGQDYYREDHHLVSIGLRAFADAEGRTDIGYKWLLLL